jgi:endonuclease/exonuclease/phosphatase family metal-dependent hydrolase
MPPTQEIAVAWYNLENLFEPGDHPELRAEWTEARYAQKLRNLASVVRNLGDGGPDLLAVCEAQSERVLRDLVAELPGPDSYDVVLLDDAEDGADADSIDVGVIYRSAPLTVVDARAFNVRKRLPTRDILDVTFRTAGGVDFHVVANHWPSRSGGQYLTEPYRMMVAENCAWLVEQHYEADPHPNLLVLGDFNDDPSDRSVREYLLAIRNRDRVAARRGGSNARPYLYNLSWHGMTDHFPGTFYYGSTPAGWHMLDQVMVARGMLTGQRGLRVDESSLAVFRPAWIRQGNRPKPYRKRGGEWVEGYSDHFPVTVTVRVE